MTVRAKFKLNSKTEYEYGPTKLHFNAVCQDETEENRRFQKYTPSGELNISIDNPSAVEYFKIGKSYYLDFEEAP